MLTLALALNIVAGSCRTVILPAQKTDHGCVEHSAGFTRCSFGNRELTRRVNRLVELRLKDAAQYEDSSSNGTCQPDEAALYGRVDAMCEPPLVVGGRLISFGCGASYSTGAHPDASSFSVNLLISGSDVKEIGLRDLLSDDPAEEELWKLVDDAVRRQLTTTCADANTRDGNARNVDSFYFEAEGLTFTYNHYTFGYCIHDVTIPFSKLSGILKPEYLVRPNDSLQRTRPTAQHRSKCVTGSPGGPGR